MNLVRHITGDGIPGGILVVGAHPKLEESTPFTTPAGYMLRKMAASLGIEQIRFEYVCERKFDRKKESLFFDKACTVPKDEFRAWASDLRRRIDEQKPKVIVALGATAMRALTNYVAIDKTHCYVIRDIANLPYPVIPAYSHNEIYRERSNAFWLRYALHKANEVLKGRTDPPQTLITNNNFQVACTFLKEILDNATEVCIDIETAGKTEELTALGISASPDKALSVSRVGDDALSPIEWDMIVQFFREIMESPKIAKIGQNFSFDALMLWRIHGIGLAGSVWDTRHAGNVIYSDLDKSLEELIRLYLYRAPHKGSWKTTGEQLRVYNAQDIITTHRIALAQRTHMAELGILEYFQNTPQALFVPALNLMKRGLKVDLHSVTQLRKQVEHYLKGMRETLGSWAQQYTPPAERNKRLRDVYADSEASFDKPVHAPTTKDLVQALKGIIPEKDIKEFYVAKPQHAKNGLIPGRIYKKAYKKATEYTAQSFNPASPTQVMSVLKNAGVKVPKSKSSQTKMWQESTNDNALKKILDRNKDSEDALEFVRNLLQYRAGNKLLTSYCKAALDPDGRWRCEYNIEGTETGRSSSKKTFWGTGGNNQNIPRDGFNGIKFKNVFVPDDNKILFQSDQSSAEARVVAYLSGSAKLIELIENDEDIHVYAINAILGRDITSLKESDPKEYKRLRQIGKVVNHGGNYDMGPSTLADSALKQGLKMSPDEAAFFLKKRKEVFPEIYENWHESIKAQLHKDRTLWTPFGRRRVFLGKISDNTYREAYAFIPQSTIPHITNLMWLWVENVAKPAFDVDVLQMGHDALLMQVAKDQVKAFADAYILTTRTIRFTIGERTNLNIPWDAEFGYRWGSLKGLDEALLER